MTDSHVCSVCGEFLPLSALECPNCGAALEGANFLMEQEQASATAPLQPRRRSSSGSGEKFRQRLRRQYGILHVLTQAGNSLRGGDFSAAISLYRQATSLLGRQKRSGLPALALEQLIQAVHARMEIMRPNPQPAPRRWSWPSALTGALAASLGLAIIFTGWSLTRPAQTTAPSFSLAGGSPSPAMTLTSELSATPAPTATSTPLPSFSPLSASTVASITQVRFWSAGDDIPSVSFSPDGRRLVSSDSAGEIKVWALWQDTPLMEMPGTKAVFSPDGRWLGVAGPDGLALYDADDGKLARWLDQNSPRPYYAVRFSPDSQIIMGGANDTRFYAWSVNDGSKLQSSGGFTRAVSFFSFSADSRLLAAGADDKVYVWNLQQQNIGSLGFRVATPYMVALRLRKLAIAFDIKIEPLEQSCISKNAVTTALGCFDFIIQAFHKAATKTSSKVVDNFIEPIIECCQEFAKTGQCALRDFVLPCQ